MLYPDLLKKAKLELDIEIGDILLGGRFKNQRTKVKKFGRDDLGQPTINGKKLLSWRIEKQMPLEERSKKTQNEIAEKKGGAPKTKTLKERVGQTKKAKGGEDLEIAREHVNKKYLPLYNTFDDGHNLSHAEEVATKAKLLAQKHAPKDVMLAELAAKLHDIGLTKAREGHEQYGYNMVLKDRILQRLLSEQQHQRVAEAVREHRASTGNPKDVLGKIISDADRDSDSYRGFSRAYLYGHKNIPGLTHDQHAQRAIEHMKAKYSKVRPHFPETQAAVQKMIAGLRDKKLVKEMSHRVKKEVIAKESSLSTLIKNASFLMEKQASLFSIGKKLGVGAAKTGWWTAKTTGKGISKVPFVGKGLKSLAMPAAFGVGIHGINAAVNASGDPRGFMPAFAEGLTDMNSLGGSVLGATAGMVAARGVGNLGSLALKMGKPITKGKIGFVPRLAQMASDTKISKIGDALTYATKKMDPSKMGPSRMRYLFGGTKGLEKKYGKQFVKDFDYGMKHYNSANTWSKQLASQGKMVTGEGALKGIGNFANEMAFSPMSSMSALGAGTLALGANPLAQFDSDLYTPATMKLPNWAPGGKSTNLST